MRARVLGGLGALATLLAVAVVLDPGLADALPGIGQFLESQDPERLLLALGLLVAGYAAWSARAGSPERPPAGGPSAKFARTGDPPEAVSAARRTRTGESFDARVRAACAGDGEALESVQSALADAAASARERAGDRTSEQARRAIDRGEWTDDDLAAAFLAGQSGPGFSLWTRLREWLDPEAERRRRIDRTVAAVRVAMDRDGADSSSADSNSSDSDEVGDDASPPTADQTGTSPPDDRTGTSPTDEQSGGGR